MRASTAARRFTVSASADPRAHRAPVLFLVLLAACGPRPPVPVPVRAAHGSRDLPRVALTFDACSSPRDNRFDTAVVAALERAGVPATFFLGGRWMEANPEAVRRLAANPRFELGVHGWTHRHPAALSDADLCTELDRCAAELERFTGHRPALYRPPYGIASRRDARIAAGAGFSTIEYDLASGDPDPVIAAGRLARTAVREARNGSIIVFHVNGRGWHTAEALPVILAGLKGRGLQCVTVGNLLAGRP